MSKLLDSLTVTTPYQRLAKDNCIAIILTGSHLYGTSTPQSDMDYEGIFIEPPEYVILRRLEVTQRRTSGFPT